MTGHRRSKSGKLHTSTKKSGKSRMRNIRKWREHFVPDLKEIPPLKENTPSTSDKTVNVEELPPLAIETGPVNLDTKCVGRRIVDIAHFFEQLQKFAEHREKSFFSCGLENFCITGECRFGLRSRLKIECRMCKHIGWVDTNPESPAGKMDINLAMISGIYGAGIGFSTMEEVAGAIDMPFMSFKKFKNCEQLLQKVIDDTAHKDMQIAAAKEAELAKQLGNVDSDGTPLVTVVADGSWAKRSFKTKYDSNSGSAVIVGQKTSKVLFMGVKNKYCVVCATAGPGNDPPTHICFKNWTGSSSSMEAAIILEGFKLSEELYGIRYNKLIADGDSSVYMNLIKNRPYKNTPIQKIECSNHLLRNLCKKLRAISTTHIGTAQLRKVLGSKIKAMRGAVNKASKHWADENVGVEERIEFLRRDIKNTPHHVFGNHARCASYFCTGPKKDEINLVSQLQNRGMWEKIMEAFIYLSRHSSSLILGLTSNIAESINNRIAKAIGGKRINYCLRGSYQTRCLSAVICTNSKVLQTRLNKQLYSRSPGKFTKLLEQRRLKALESNKRKSRTRLFRADKSSADYGPLAVKPDLEESLFKKECEEFLLSLSLTPKMRSELEASTIHQGESMLWHEERRKRLTASRFGEICKRRKQTKCCKLVDRLLYSPNISTIAIEYGRKNEQNALFHLKENGIVGTKCGLFVDDEFPFLGASPDGLISDDGLIEIKCPFSIKDLSPEEGLRRLPYIDKKTGLLKRNSNYYYQIQGQLAITKRNYCVFVIYTPKPPYIVTECITKDEEFWREAALKLSKFYYDCVLPEIVDPRKSRSMPLREPYLT